MAGSDKDVALAAAAQSVGDSRVPAELIAAYREGAGHLRRSVEGMTREQLTTRPIAGKMSSLEVLCHVADADQFLADRIKRTVATDRPLLVGVDGIAYLDALHYHARDVELQLALVDATREQLAADLDRLGEEAWERPAVHTETGLVTTRQLLLHAIRHLERHIDAIAEKRAALGI